MKLDRKARKYASVLLNVAQTQNTVREVNESLQLVSGLLRVDSTFRFFFHTRKIDSGVKANILTTITKSSCNPIVTEFFGILAEQKEWNLFLQTTIVYKELYMDLLNLVSVNAYTAESLEEAEYDDLKSSLEKASGKTADFQAEVDPELIGGIKLRIGNLFLDGSIQHRLNCLRNELLQS